MTDVEMQESFRKCKNCGYKNNISKVLTKCLYCDSVILHEKIPNENFKSDNPYLNSIAHIFEDAKLFNKYEIRQIESEGHVKNGLLFIKVFFHENLKDKTGDIIQSDVTFNLLKIGLVICTIGEKYMWLYKIYSGTKLDEIMNSNLDGEL